MNRTAYLLAAALLLASCGGSAARTGRAGDDAHGRGGRTRPLHLPREGGPPPFDLGLHAGGCSSPKDCCGKARGSTGSRSCSGPTWRRDARRCSSGSPRSEFGEGIALVGGELFQLTWQSNTAHVYDPEKRTGLRDHRYAGEGWGLTTDGEKLYMTDGTANLYTIDPATFRRERRTTVTLWGEPVEPAQRAGVDRRPHLGQRLHDRPDRHHRPGDGPRGGIVDLRGLLPDEDRTPGTDVLNGIAYDAATGAHFPHGQELEQTLRDRARPPIGRTDAAADGRRCGEPLRTDAAGRRKNTETEHDKQQTIRLPRRAHPAARRRIRHDGAGLRPRRGGVPRRAVPPLGGAGSRGATTCLR